MTRGPAFERYIGIDYSGAETPESSLKGLRVFLGDRANPPSEVPPPPSPRKYWARREVAEWLELILREGAPTLVGIDHGFSFPSQYFAKYRLPLDWGLFLADFQAHWPTHENYTYVDFVRDGVCGRGSSRCGDPRWRRLTEIRARAKSVFHFDVPGSVAKSTHAGLPWLLYLRKELGSQIHFWPFDGWTPPPGRSVLVEAYPSLWSVSFPRDARDSHQHDAYSIAAWLRQSDAGGTLPDLFAPSLSPGERTIAEIEGWILGVA